MPRPPRDTTWRFHHITSRGNNRRSMYEDVHDRETFYGILADAICESSVLCHADVLMGNHYHLLLEGAMGDVSALLWWVNHRYALAYNRRHGRINHLVGRRFHCSPIADHAGTRAVAVYIALNPVRAGFCTRPHEWPYGSFGAHTGAEWPRSHLTLGLTRDLFPPSMTLARACHRALGVGGRPPLRQLLPARRDLTRRHLIQAIRIFGYSHEEIARHYDVTPRSLNRWVVSA